jgi:hypothetical protein
MTKLVTPGLMPGTHVLPVFKQTTWIAGTKPGHDGKRVTLKLLYESSRDDSAAAASRRSFPVSAASARQAAASDNQAS